MATTEALTFKVVEELQTVLDNNISDPNTDRDGNDTWIYTIPIEFGIADYPRIHITETSSIHTGYGLGSNERQVDTVVQISVFHSVEDGYKLDIDNDDELEGPREIVSYLSQRITEVLNSNQAQWQNEGCVQYFVTVNENLVQDSKNSVIQNNIEAELRTVK